MTKQKLKEQCDLSLSPRNDLTVLFFYIVRRKYKNINMQNIVSVMW